MRRHNGGPVRQNWLPFPSNRTTAEWEAHLGQVLGRTVRVSYGRSRTVPVRVEADSSTVDLRLHRFFRAAPDPIAAALGTWLRAGRRARRAGPLLDAWIAEQTRKLPPPRLRLRPQGRAHDLEPLLRDTIAAHLPELQTAPPAVTWGTRRRSRSVRSLHLGTYDPDTDVVRLHPVLDHAEVPEFFVRFVLFHELLHAAVPATLATDGRLYHHSPEFRRREREHPDHPRALAFEEHNLLRLIDRARRGS